MGHLGGLIADALSLVELPESSAAARMLSENASADALVPWMASRVMLRVMA